MRVCVASSGASELFWYMFPYKIPYTTLYTYHFIICFGHIVLFLDITVGVSSQSILVLWHSSVVTNKLTHNMKNESNKKLKQATLQPDEFHPKGAFKSFWMLPKVIASNSDLSPGAKLLYGLIVVQCQLTGTAWPEHKTLRAELGGISEKTLNRWQMELVKLGLLRVNQKGRGLSNNYYLLRSVIVGNAEEGEFLPGARYVHTDLVTGEIRIVEEWLVEANFRDDIYIWWLDVIKGIERTFPKPCGHYDRKEYGIIKQEYAEKLANYIAGNPEIA